MVKTIPSSRIFRIPLLAAALAGLAAGSPALAQTVRWNLPDLNLSEGKVSPLYLVFENCSPDSDPKLPKVEGFDFGKVIGKQSEDRTEMVNFKVNRVERRIYSYLVRPGHNGRIEIPAFDVETNKGKIRVAALSLDVEEGVAAAAQQSGNPLISTTIETSVSSPWQGQIFPLRYELLLMVDEQASVNGDPNKWKPSELVIEDWPQSQKIRRFIGNSTRQGLLYQTQAYAPKAGNLTIAPLEMEAEIVTGRSLGFFGQPTTERIALKSNPLKLTVRELPKPAPASFTGAVGQFRLESKLSQNEVSAGQPVTWTLILKGTGNWPDNFKLPERHVPSNLRVIQPDAKKENVPDKLFEASITEDVVLIPDQAGKIDLAPVQFTYFNPEKGAYETLSTEPASLTVNPDLNAPAAGNSITAPNQALHDNVSPSRPKAEADLSRPALPRDPIPGSASSFAPVNNMIVVGTSAALVLGLLPLWLLLARKHSVRTDEITRQRKAFDQALAAVREIENATEIAARKNLLLRWQHMVSSGFAVEHATPSVRQLESSPNVHLDEHWIQLWREADAALYSAESQLPPDWTSRAKDVSARLRLPRVPLHKTFSPRHLFPVILALAVLSLSSARAAGEDPVAAYQKGDFDAARKAWQIQAEQHPGDWIAHNNLGLALSQEKEWGPAVAQWASAFLHSPSHPDVEWNLALGLSKLDNKIPELDYLQGSEILPSLARQLSPFQWQALSFGAVLAAVVAAAVMLFHRYHPSGDPGKGKIRSWLPRAVLVLGVLAFVTALAALHTYGVLGDPRAGMIVSKTQLKSIPTDADNKQATREISTGMVVIAEKPFLGWWRVRLGNNETGWVRKEHLQRLYN